MRRVQAAIDVWIASAQAAGRAVPAPRTPSATEHLLASPVNAARLTLRALHRRANAPQSWPRR